MKKKEIQFDPAKPWEDQLVIISLENCIQERESWIEIHKETIKERRKQGRDTQFDEYDLEDEQDLLDSLTRVLHYYKGQS